MKKPNSPLLAMTPTVGHIWFGAFEIANAEGAIFPMQLCAISAVSAALPNADGNTVAPTQNWPSCLEMNESNSIPPPMICDAISTDDFTGVKCNGLSKQSHALRGRNLFAAQPSPSALPLSLPCSRNLLTAALTCATILKDA